MVVEMKNIKIGKKIALGFFIIIILVIIIAVMVTISNMNNTQNLMAIEAGSMLQAYGSELSTAFFSSRINAKIIVIRPDDEAYKNAVSYLETCNDILKRMDEYIDGNPLLDKFRGDFNDMVTKLTAYSKELDNLQISNTDLNNIENNIRTLGKTLTELSDALDEKNILAVNQNISGNIQDTEINQHINNLLNGAMISNGIWDIRNNSNIMFQFGNDYTGHNTDLKMIENVIDLAGKIESSPDDSSNITELKNQLSLYREYIVQFSNEMEFNDTAIANLTSNGINALNSINTMITNVDDAMNNRIQNSINTSSFSLIIVMAITVISIIFAVIIAIYITKSIVAVLNKSIQNMENISEAVVKSSRELNDGSTHLAEGASEQASSIEETSATMTQTASMVRLTKKNTQEAASLSEQTINDASESVEKLGHLIGVMTNLNESANKIKNITDTINSIAQQTNILSLNASVEAFRAGEAGKSFSVVAEEVRSLSQKSAEAANSTAEIIENNIELIDQANKSAEVVNEALNEIFSDVKNVNALLLEISSASEEQSHGIDQINIAISQIEKATQSNAAVAQQSAASASEMMNYSDTLVSVTSDLSSII